MQGQPRHTLGRTHVKNTLDAHAQAQPRQFRKSATTETQVRMPRDTGTFLYIHTYVRVHQKTYRQTTILCVLDCVCVCDRASERVSE